jgi:Tol biopolymer transport system component
MFARSLRGSRRLGLALGVVALLAAVAVFFAIRASGGTPRGKGIVFQARVHGQYQLFTINTDGTGLRQLTHLRIRGGSIPGAGQPAWSPDAKTIVFDTDYGGTKDAIINLFTIRPDGSGLAKVPLHVGLFNAAPAFSPDGKLVSFDWEESARPLHEQGIDVVNADGSDVRRLTALDSPNRHHGSPNWSPDGDWVVFTESRGAGATSILKIRPDGTGLRELTPWELRADNAKWSPDGSRILFNSHHAPLPGEDANLYTVRPDGSGLVQLTHYRGGRLNAFAGGWSPDGEHIVFHVRGHDPDGPGVNQLFIVDADGGNVHQLTHLPRGTDPGYASWSPAG